MTRYTLVVTRWDWLEGVKSETPSRAAVRELCKLMATELGKWPPSVEWSEFQASDLSVLFGEPDNETRPSSVAIDEACKRLQWEFARETEASDYYLRNHLLEKACDGALDCLASDFVFAYLREGFFSLMERTEGRLGRSDVLDGLDEMRALLHRAFC